MMEYGGRQGWICDLCIQNQALVKLQNKLFCHVMHLLFPNHIKLIVKPEHSTSGGAHVGWSERMMVDSYACMSI